MPLISNREYEELPPWLKTMYQNLATRSEAVSNRDYERYPGERLEPIPQDLLKAHEIGRNTESYLPYLNRAGQLLDLGSLTFPDEYQNYMNPYQQAVVNRIAEEGNRNFNENILPSLEAKFVGLGQHGSSKHQQLAERAARDLQNEIMGRQQSALSQGYQQAGQLFNADRARQLEAANQVSGMGATRQAGQLADIAMLGEQGRYQQQQGQAGKDIGYEDFLRRTAHAPQVLSQHTGIMHGIPQQAQATSFTQTPGTPQTNILGQIGSLAGNIYGARMASGRKRGGHINNYKMKKNNY